MDRHPDKWWQLRLTNMLLSIALCGVSLTLFQFVPQNPPGLILWLIVCCASIGSAVGMLLGRVVEGLEWGVFGAGILLLVLTGIAVALLVLQNH